MPQAQGIARGQRPPGPVAIAVRFFLGIIVLVGFSIPLHGARFPAEAPSACSYDGEKGLAATTTTTIIITTITTTITTTTTIIITYYYYYVLLRTGRARMAGDAP